MVTVYTAYRQRQSSGRLIHSKRPSPNKKTRHPFGYRVFKDIASCAASASFKLFKEDDDEAMYKNPYEIRLCDLISVSLKCMPQ